MAKCFPKWLHSFTYYPQWHHYWYKVIIISKNPFYLGMKLYSTLAVLLCLLSHDVHTSFDHSRPPNYLSHLTLSQGPWLHWQYLLTYLVAHYFKAILTSFARCVATRQSLRTLDYRCPWGLLCSRGERPSTLPRCFWVGRRWLSRGAAFPTSKFLPILQLEGKLKQ